MNKKQSVCNMKTPSLAVAPARRGSALVAVFWVLTILAIIITASSRLVKYDADVVLHQVHGFRAKQLAESGLNLAAHPSVENGDVVVVTPLSRGSGTEGEGYKFSIKGEGVRFNINRLINDLQAGGDLFLRELMLEHWEVDAALVDTAIGALKDWVDRNDEESLNGAEFEYYEARGRSNQPYNRFFHSLDELILVRGWNEVVADVPNWRNWFTVLAPAGLDINYAEAFLVAAASGADETTIDEVIRQRVVGEDGELHTSDDDKFGNVDEALSLLGLDPNAADYAQIAGRFSAEKNSVKRIESTGWANGFAYKLTLVVQDQNGRPTVLEKKEEIIPWHLKEN